VVTEKDGAVMREPKLTAGQGAQTVKSSSKQWEGGWGREREREIELQTGGGWVGRERENSSAKQRVGRGIALPFHDHGTRRW